MTPMLTLAVVAAEIIEHDRMVVSFLVEPWGKQLGPVNTERTRYFL